MVHFPGFARARLWIHRAVIRFYRIGFPHSEIPGSKPACGSPGLIAACHVLHRLLLPRHPPCALSSLTKFYDPRRLLITAPPCGRAIPADFKASHKNLLSLVDYPIYSVVKHRPHQLALTIPPGRVLSIAAQSSTPIRIGAQLRAGQNVGGADRDRTGDLLVANQALSQLSYSPVTNGGPG